MKLELDNCEIAISAFGTDAGSEDAIPRGKTGVVSEVHGEDELIDLDNFEER